MRGKRERGAEFLAHGAGYNLYLSHGEAVMVLGNSATVRMRFAGANASALAEGLEQQRSRTNYFIGKLPGQWRTGIPNFAQVRYRNVYPGVDLIYYGNQKQFEYDFVVNPYGDSGKILLEFTGAEKTSLDARGDVVMQTGAGDLRWHKPVAYQDIDGCRREIKCAYARKDAHHFALRLEAYDRAKSVVIDPVLDYSTFLGGSAEDDALGIAVDAHGDVYVTGSTLSTDFPITGHAYQKMNKGRNAFVTKIDAADCALVYSTYIGGTGADYSYGIGLDALGNAYLTGSTSSADFPITQHAFQKSLKGVSNAFVTKLDAEGNALLYSTYLGGSSFDSAAGIAVDAHDSAYVTGQTNSSDFPVQHAFQETLSSANGNAFVTKLDAAGTALLYSTFLGGSGSDQGTSIAVNAREDAYVTGTTGSPDFPVHHAFQPKPKNASHTAFVTEFDATGVALKYSTFLGGSGVDQGTGIAVDTHDNAYVTGITTSLDFPTKHAFQPRNKDLFYSAFVTKFDAAGTALVYSTYLGGSKHQEFAQHGTLAAGIAVDHSGNAYVTGQTDDTDFPLKNAFQPTFKGGSFRNCFVTEFGATEGVLIYSSYLGGSGDDIAVGIAVDNRGNAYVTGDTGSPDFPIRNAFQTRLNGSDDAFVTKISAR